MSEYENSFKEWLKRHPFYEPVGYETHTQVIQKQIDAFRAFADERFQVKMKEIEDAIDGIHNNGTSKG